MISKLTHMLDSVANTLESKGFFREAYEIDKISNMLDPSLVDIINVQLRRAFDWPIYDFKLPTDMINIVSRVIETTNVIAYKIHAIGTNEKNSVPVMIVAYMEKSSKSKIKFTIIVKDNYREWKGFNKKIIGGNTYWIHKIDNIDIRKIPTNIGETLKNIILSSYSYLTVGPSI